MLRPVAKVILAATWDACLNALLSGSSCSDLLDFGLEYIAAAALVVAFVCGALVYAGIRCLLAAFALRQDWLRSGMQAMSGRRFEECFPGGGALGALWVLFTVWVRRADQLVSMPQEAGVLAPALLAQSLSDRKRSDASSEAALS